MAHLRQNSSCSAVTDSLVLVERSSEALAWTGADGTGVEHSTRRVGQSRRVPSPAAQRQYRCVQPVQDLIGELRGCPAGGTERSARRAFEIPELGFAVTPNFARTA